MFDHNSLSIYYQNVRGLRTKTNLFYNSLLLNDFDIICLSETWLLDSVSSSELFDYRYTVYRCDRSYESRGDKLGGGVLIALRREFQVVSSENITFHKFSAETVTVTIHLKHSRLLKIYCCYFPHCPEQEESEAYFFDTVSNMIVDRPNDVYLIVGDFNISNGIWLQVHNYSELCDSFRGSLVGTLHHFLCFSDLKQYNTIKNCNERLLDLVLCSTDCVVSRSSYPLLDEDKYHPALEISPLLVRPNILHLPSRIIRLYHRADSEAIIKSLGEIDWINRFLNLDIEAATTSFYDTIFNIIDKHIPSKVVHQSRKYPVWYNGPLIKIIKEKLKFHRKWKTYCRISDYDTFVLLRERQRKVEVDCYNAYIDNAEREINRNSKYFWSYIKSKREGSNDLPNRMFFGETSSSDGEEICGLFNSYFQSAFEPEMRVNGVLPDSQPCVDLCTIELTTSIVEKYLKNLNVDKGVGPDALPPRFLKQFCDVLALPIFLLFRLSLNTGCLPTLWKKSFIAPILKSAWIHQ
ncbi:uncharacterized protein LOC123654790 [Melitaea cinxia]|uniref:uncharacterized protein LOC123654790 n=1 Tax=Melitaea cinxia TaxID=113334 RepID=UPI001E270887|nr:uncharacterized protein LOC123654790 [Melitaea cinxia]